MSVPLLVADSGPLIALARLDLLALPGRYFTSVVVTTSVWEEVTRSPRADELERLTAALSGGWFTLADDPLTVPDQILQTGLDAGERNSIALSLAMSSAVLIDEKRGRRVATALGLPVIGTVGLLLRAREEGAIPSLRGVLGQLRDSGYFLSDALIADLLARLGE